MQNIKMQLRTIRQTHGDDHQHSRKCNYQTWTAVKHTERLYIYICTSKPCLSIYNTVGLQPLLSASAHLQPAAHYRRQSAAKSPVYASPRPI